VHSVSRPVGLTDTTPRTVEFLIFEFLMYVTQEIQSDCFNGWKKSNFFSVPGLEESRVNSCTAFLDRKSPGNATNCVVKDVSQKTRSNQNCTYVS
jgi:hypothetical protein